MDKAKEQTNCFPKRRIWKVQMLKLLNLLMNMWKCHLRLGILKQQRCAQNVIKILYIRRTEGVFREKRKDTTPTTQTKNLIKGWIMIHWWWLFKDSCKQSSRYFWVKFFKSAWSSIALRKGVRSLYKTSFANFVSCKNISSYCLYFTSV